MKKISMQLNNTSKWGSKQDWKFFLLFFFFQIASGSAKPSSIFLPWNSHQIRLKSSHFYMKTHSFGIIQLYHLYKFFYFVFLFNFLYHFCFMICILLQKRTLSSQSLARHYSPEVASPRLRTRKITRYHKNIWNHII